MKIVRWMEVFLGTLLLAALLASGALAAEGEIQVTPGVPVEVEKDVLTYSGISFSLTAQAGQTIAVEVSGLDAYEYLYVTWADLSYRAEGNGTYYLHVPQSGVQVWKLRLGNLMNEGTVRFVFKLLRGSAEEPNDTLETATRLSLGTDQTFTVDGWGDEDWFTFEAAPEAGEIANYTLRLLDFQTDYSDELVYDVYAPDGSVVSRRAEVNIRHTAQIACTQQGRYAIRVYTNEEMQISRNPLRIRVDEGGLDPYEPNDTWQTAAPITLGEPIPYVLSNTADQDWFYFTVPEGGMTMELHVENTTYVYLYDGAMLAQGNMDWLYGTNLETLRYHFTKAGAYYLRLSTRSGYTSEAVRTFTLTLEQDPDAEPNDTWKTATPLYDGVAQKLVLSANNDEDWFRLEVPEGTQTLLIGAFSEDRCSFALYREKDFLYHGDDAKPVTSDPYWEYEERALAVSVAEPGAYLLKFSPYYDDTFSSITILFRCLEQALDDHATLDTALPGEPGEWMDCFGDTYIDLGQLPEGAIVNVEWDRYEAQSSEGWVVRDDGQSFSALATAHDYSTRLAAGHYYLRFPGIETLNQDGEYTTSRVRYFVGTEDVDVDSITIAAPDSITMTVGEKTFVEVSGSPENSRWYVDSIYLQYEDSCTYNSTTGYLTAKSTGEGTLVARLRDWDSDEKITKTIPVTVVDFIPTTSITITGAPDTLPLGQAAQLEAVLSEGATEPVDWKSSDPKVLYVSSKGRVTAVGIGEAEITAATTSGYSKTISITVTEAAAPPESLVSGVKLSEYAMTLYCKEPGKALTATVLPQGVDAAVTWRSSNSAVAAVDQKGVVTPVASGVAVITAGAGDYQTGCIVTVLPARERVTGVEITDAPKTVPLHGEAVLMATIYPEDATTQTVTWTSSDPDVATVSRTGIVTALSVGETTITVTTVDGGFTDQITITVTAAPQMGDVNLDGYVDSGDAMLCLRAAVGAYTVPEAMQRYADVNHDGLVDAGDAVRILRYDAGLLENVELQ